MKRQNQIGAALAITSSIIWSGNFIVSRYAIHLAGPISLAFMRWSVATICMFPFAYKNVKKEWPMFLQKEEKWVDSVFASLTPDERIGQLFMIPAYSNKDMKHVREVREIIEKYKIGDDFDINDTIVTI